MLGWALFFLMCALCAALVGFGGAVSAAATGAQLLFFVFAGLFARALIADLARDPEGRQ